MDNIMIFKILLVVFIILSGAIIRWVVKKDFDKNWERTDALRKEKIAMVRRTREVLDQIAERSSDEGQR
ncbi:hypothetical protein B1757_02335 [Acidithiobacillus marinus]|uniref:Uncharacterized protein n=1 Tax=Acidithiobacillus marinus TaxID=187490 RepID=A0A2I1DPQ4_9PROT|nr:hypothetical protein [Acidithiobacillus marinus]PKY11819.1 hypothetical protein B1757_02335 [Acidithiobacillus marinus]